MKFMVMVMVLPVILMMLCALARRRKSEMKIMQLTRLGMVVFRGSVKCQVSSVSVPPAMWTADADLIFMGQVTNSLNPVFKRELKLVYKGQIEPQWLKFAIYDDQVSSRRAISLSILEF